MFALKVIICMLRVFSEFYVWETFYIPFSSRIVYQCLDFLYIFLLYSAWEGRYCEIDVDGCIESPCFPEVECLDSVAPLVGATCADCPLGYNGDGKKCTGNYHYTLTIASYVIIANSGNLCRDAKKKRLLLDLLNATFYNLL